MNDINTKVIMENTSEFNILVIKHTNIKDLDWNDPNYISMILNNSSIDSINVMPDNFMDIVCKELDVENIKDQKIYIRNDIISDEPKYVYEMLYVDMIEKNKIIENELGTLLSNEDKIYSNAIILKTELSNNSMVFNSMDKKDLQRILYHRSYTKIVYYNDEWIEDVSNDINMYASHFFGHEGYKKKELAFLSHNINIYYDTSYGEKGICGKLIDEPIERCIWFSMINDDKRGNITLDEVKKIIFLSNKLENYSPDIDITEKKYDKYNRLIVNNKYKILDSIFNSNL